MLRIAIIFAIIVAYAGYYYVLDGSIPDESSYEFDISDIRALADAPVPELPIEIRTGILAKTPAPYFALRAGGGVGEAVMTRSVFQIVTEDGYYVLEAGMDLPLAEQFGQAEGFSEDVWNNIQDVMSSATGIVVTHEHPDHIGGIVRHRNPAALAGKIILTQEQYAGLSRYALDGEVPAGLRAYEPVILRGLHLVAPGIVMIRAEGHTPGSVMFYVRLQSGAEYLFVGDIAYTASNIRDGVDRARFIRLLMVDPEDRDAVVNQLRALHDLSLAEPDIHIIPAHADEVLKELLATGAIHEGIAGL